MTNHKSLNSSPPPNRPIYSEIDPTRVGSTETLHSRLWLDDPYHVGGGYGSPVSLPHLPHKLVDSQIKMIDRRFERQGGMWLERIEWSVPQFFGSQTASIVVDPKALIRAVMLEGELFALERDTSLIDQRSSLPFHRRPSSLKRLQGQRAQISPRLFKAMTAPHKPSLKRCFDGLSPHKRSGFAHLVLRLNINHRGKLISAGATHQLSWPLTQCLLKRVSSLKFPPPTLPLKSPLHDKRETYIPPLIIKWINGGATLAWPLSFRLNKEKTP